MDPKNKYFLYDNINQAMFFYDNYIYPYNRDTFKKANNSKNIGYLEGIEGNIVSASIYTSFVPQENSNKKSSYDAAGIICIYSSYIAYSHKGLFNITQDKIDIEDVSTITIYNGNNRGIFSSKGFIEIYYEHNKNNLSFSISSKDYPYLVGRITGAILYENFPFILANSQDYVTSFIKKPNYKEFIENFYKEKL